MRFASSSNTIYVSGAGTCTLEDLAASSALRSATLRRDGTTWYLGNNLRLEGGARLELHGGPAGGGVDELRLRSDPDPVPGTVRNFVWLRAEWGTLDLVSTKVTSWGPGDGPDTDTSDGRAFIHVRSFADPATGQARESRMDIRDSDVGYLGWNAAESYGLVWKVYARSGVPAPFDTVNVLGDVTGSRLHHNYFGAYTYGAFGMLWEGDEFDHNVAYGLDPHDDSDHLVIRGNHSHDNGNHGIICSQRCDHLLIEDNLVERNVGHGIMLHRGVTDTLVRDNQALANTDTGIVVFDSDGNELTRNTSSGNLRGVRLSVGSSGNRFTGNDISGNTSYGVYFYKGSDEPTGDDGRPRANTFEANRITGNGGYAVNLADADGNLFTGTTFSGNKRGLYLGTSSGNRIDGLRPDLLTVETSGASGKPGTTTLSDFERVEVRQNSYATTSLEDAGGRVFDQVDEKLATTVSAGASSLALTPARIGTAASVLARPLWATTSGGSAAIDPTVWTTSPLRLEWTAKAVASTQTLRQRVGGLVAGQAYRVTRNGTTVATATADPAGEISFQNSPGTTSTVTYSVRPA
jgi:parallel beta-helix repeat protein